MKNVLFLILLYNLLQLVKSFSNNQIYSNYFLSNYNSNPLQQYSNYFLSNYNSNSIKYSNYYNLLTSNYNSFNEYLSIITSTQFYPSSVSKSLPKSSGKNNEYLSIIKTISSQYTSIIYYSTSVTTLKPTLNPTTFNPTTFNPTLKPTTFITTFNPTLKPETPVLVFDTSLSFNNYATIELDTTSQKAIILATSNSMNISASYVEYIGSALKTRRLTIFKIQGYNIIVTLKTTLPISCASSSISKFLYRSSPLVVNLI